MSPWDLGMAPGRQPCNMTYTEEQTCSTQNADSSAQRLLLPSAAASCMRKGSHGLLPTQLPDKLQSHRGLGLCLEAAASGMLHAHGLVGCKFLGSLHVLF